MADSKDTNTALATRQTRSRRWDPFSLFADLETEMDRLMGGRLPAFLPVRRSTGALGEGWAPSADVFEKAGELVVKAELPGVNKDDVEVSVEQGTLVIKGQRKAEEEVKEDAFYRMERFTGGFYRRFPMPEGIDEEKISATFNDGVLEVHVPRPTGDEAVPNAKKIAIK